MPPPLDAELLLRHADWVHRLARELTADSHEAEDVAQETFLRALLRPPAHALAARAWLARVVKNVATNARVHARRRAVRERAVSRPEAQPSVAEMHERMALHKLLADLVLELPPEQREAVYLRYFEDLPPRAIARLTWVPVETARTRIKRGLERLRALLDARHCGDRRAWTTGLSALARPEKAIVATVSSFFAALLVTTKTKLACSAFACLAFVVALWQLAYAPAGMPGAGSGGDSASLTLASRPATLAAVEPAPVVRAHWEEGQAPATGIALTVARSSRESPEFEDHASATDERGEALVTGLVPGTFSIQLANGSSQTARVEVGRRAEVTFALRGATIEGIVLDARQAPIPGAAIEVTDVTGQPRVMGTSEFDGAFRLRGLFVDRAIKLVYVGARKGLYAPSPRAAVDLATQQNARLALVLRLPGGDLRGLVRGPDGKPVAGAFVQVSGEIPSVSGSEIPPSPPPRARSDAEGRFLVAGLPAGQHKVTVRGRDLAPAVESVAIVAGQEAFTSFDLVAGVTVAGRITTGGGEPAPDVLVAVGENRVIDGQPYALARTTTRTSADGGYRLRGLMPGQLVISAATLDARGLRVFAEATLAARAGDELRWDARLEKGMALRGRVIDERGAPVREASVRGSSHSRPPLGGQATTDAEGRFALESWRDVPTDIEVQVDNTELYPRGSVTGVSPREEVLIVLRDDRRPTVRITGVVLDADGKPAAAARFHAMPLAHDYASRMPVGQRAVDPRTGAFEVGPVFPGWWTLRIDAPGCAPCVVPAREFAANETWRLGEVRLVRPAALRVRVRFADGKPVGKAHFEIGAPDDALMTFVAIQNGEGRVELAPGRHLVQAQTDGCAMRSVPVDVAASGETELEVVLERGVAHALRFATPGGQFARLLHEIVRDERGTAVVDQWLWGAGDRDWKHGFLPGSYRVEVTTPHGWRGAATFTVGAEPRSEPTVVELR